MSHNYKLWSFIGISFGSALFWGGVAAFLNLFLRLGEKFSVNVGIIAFIVTAILMAVIIGGDTDD